MLTYFPSGWHEALSTPINPATMAAPAPPARLALRFESHLYDITSHGGERTNELKANCYSFANRVFVSLKLQEFRLVFD